MAARVMSSGVKSADVAIKAGSGVVHWITICAADASVVGIADSTTNSTTYIWEASMAAAGDFHAVFAPALQCDSGIWLDVLSGTVVVTVGYL